MKNAPSYMVACLIDDSSNRMHVSIVKPIRELLNTAIKEYKNKYPISYLDNIGELDQKFLQNVMSKKIVSIKYFFVMELLQLLKLKSILSNTEINNDFTRMLILNRLFGISLIIDGTIITLYSIIFRQKDNLMASNIDSLYGKKETDVTKSDNQCLSGFYRNQNFNKRS